MEDKKIEKLLEKIETAPSYADELNGYWNAIGLIAVALALNNIAESLKYK